MTPGWRRQLTSPWVLTLLAYGLSQMIVLAGAIIRIPLISDALGEAGYGRFVVITSAWPAIQIMANGLASTGRVVVAERPAATSPTLRALRRTGTREGLAVLGLSGLLLPVLGSTVGWGFAWSILWVGVAALVTLPVAGHQGVLEGAGRTASSHLALATTTLVGLPVLVLALGLRQDLSTVVAATMIGFVAPYLTCRLLTRWLVGVRPDDPQADPEPLEIGGLSGAMTGWSMSNVLVYIFDPVIIMLTTSAAAAGQYGLANRVTGLVTVIPVALGGLLIVWFSKARTVDGGASVLRRLLLSSLVFGGAGVALAVLLVVAGPTVGDLLGRGNIGTPVHLYFWLAVYGGLTCAAEPLISAWSAPRAAPVRAKLGLSLGVVNVALSFLLALLYGAAGPIMATVVCNLVVVLTLAYLTVRTPSLITDAGAGR